MGNLLINLPNLAVAHPYTNEIAQASVYHTFTPPTVATTAKLQPNHKRFSATHTTFRSPRVSSRL